MLVTTSTWFDLEHSALNPCAGLSVLKTCSQKWIQAQCSHFHFEVVLEDLESLPLADQVAFVKVIKYIIGTENWICWERDQVLRRRFTFSALVWALEVRPRGLALGHEQGKSIIEVLYLTQSCQQSTQSTLEP